MLYVRDVSSTRQWPLSVDAAVDRPRRGTFPLSVVARGTSWQRVAGLMDLGG